MKAWLPRVVMNEGGGLGHRVPIIDARIDHSHEIEVDESASGVTRHVTSRRIAQS